ncbi:hypothetical protein D0416_02865 [Staphylococcus epidermidis]|nr:hypothetical protein F9B42_05005 [Staphylococcus epidermidis]MBA9873946.1 hypothetical protein [Ralstonia insidiosa]MBM0766977.1 hypothetical protein [Staphylococcus epidermidis]MBM0779830.1 hypothetical protein [Staphylococcus epidermidis]MBM0808656.1 hypothetical protein [Staphylococcus epidermidis]
MINSFQSYHFSIAKNIKLVLKTIFKYVVDNVFYSNKTIIAYF